MKKSKKLNSKLQALTKFVFDNLGALIVVIAIFSIGMVYAWEPGPPQGTPVEGNVELSSGGVDQSWVENYIETYVENYIIEEKLTPPNDGNIVFITSESVSGGLGGVDAYHALCAQEAENFDLPGTYKAWIASNADDDPESTHTHHTTPYYMWHASTIGGWVKIAEDWDDLTDGTLLSPISYTLDGELGVKTCTNVGITGEVNNPDRDCDNWTNITNTSLYAKTGSHTKTDYNWTVADDYEFRYKYNGCAPLDGYYLRCRVYCFQQ